MSYISNAYQRDRKYIAELMSKKGQKNNFSLEFLARSEKSCSFHPLFLKAPLDHFSLSLSQRCKNAQNKFSNERRTTSQLEQRTDDDDAQKKARWWSIFFFFCHRRCSPSFQQRRWCVWRFPRPRPRLIDSIPRKTNSLACVLRNSSPAQGDA